MYGLKSGRVEEGRLTGTSQAADCFPSPLIKLDVSISNIQLSLKNSIGRLRPRDPRTIQIFRPALRTASSAAPTQQPVTPVQAAPRAEAPLAAATRTACQRIPPAT